MPDEVHHSAFARLLIPLFGRDVPPPMGPVFGTAYVEERPVDDHSFAMRMVIRHPVFGDLFRYSGRFSVPAAASRG